MEIFRDFQGTRPFCASAINSSSFLILSYHIGIFTRGGGLFFHPFNDLQKPLKNRKNNNNHPTCNPNYTIDAVLQQI